MDNRARRIELEDLINLRDIGDYPAGNGRRTRRRVVLRAESLARLSEAGRKALLDSGVHTIIDLRGEWELRKAPSPFAASGDVAYHNIPLHVEERPAWLPPLPHTLDDLYCLWLEHCAGQIGTIMATLADAVESRGGTVVVHCAGGKDRTGVVIALLLSLAGVPAETIAEDYTLTETYLQPIKAEIERQALLVSGDPRVARLWTQAPRKAMLRTLACLEEKYGGAESYLLSTGLSPQQINALKTHLIGD